MLLVLTLYLGNYFLLVLWLSMKAHSMYMKCVGGGASNTRTSACSFCESSLSLQLFPSRQIPVKTYVY